MFLLQKDICAQVYTNPVLPTLNDTITIFFQADLGSGGLENYDGDIYVHTGLITSESQSSSDWKYVVADWDENIERLKMQRSSDNPNLYSLKIGLISEFYNIDNTSNVIKLAMVFRSSDGTLEGKGPNFTDIFIPIIKDGIHVKFENPLDLNTKIISTKEIIEIKVHSRSLDNPLDRIDLIVNDVITGTTEQENLLYEFSVNTPGFFQFMAISYDSEMHSDTSYAYVVVAEQINEPSPQNIEEGINYHDNDPNKVTLKLLAPFKESVFVIGDFNDWQIRSKYQMKRDYVSDSEIYWWLELDNLDSNTEYAFQYLVDEKIRIADPYSRKVLHKDDEWIDDSTYPNLKKYPVQQTNDYVSVLEISNDEFEWTDDSWVRPDPNNLVIYELLIRDFSENHDFSTVIDSLNYLKNLGINAIELMPINEFEGNSSWGYNPVFYFAVDRYYGPENDLKRLVNEAHKRGIAVILDAVLNHSFGQSPMVRLYNNGNYGAPTNENIWFNTSARHPFNVGYDFNHESTFTQRFIDRVNRFWIEEFHIDGYRYDLSKGFTQNYTGDDVSLWNQYDQSRINLLLRMKNVINEYDPDAYLILEHLGNNDEEKVLADNGFMLWGIMHENFKNAAMGFDGNLVRISYKERGWNSPNLVGYMESHDEERLMYELSLYGNTFGDYDVKKESTALNRMKLSHAFMLTVPGPKMIWQFGELGYDVSINENGRTGEKQPKWEYFLNSDRRRLYNTVSELAKLKTTNSAFQTENYELDVWGKHKKILLKSENDVQLIGNFDVVTQNITPYSHNSGSGKEWYEFFSGDTVIISENPQPISLLPGEFKILSTQKLGDPIPGLLKENYPSISLTQRNIIFDEFIGSGDLPYSSKVAVRNSGTADLNIVEISNETDVFDISERAFTLEAGATKDIFIEFNPEVIGEYSDVFLIKSEGLNDTTIQVFGNYTEPIPSIPDLISPDHSSTDVSVNPIFKWNSVEYATGYDFILLSKLDTVITMSISDTTITDLVLEYALDYSWKVRATNKIGDGDWSNLYDFVTVGLPALEISEIVLNFDEFIGSGDLPYSSKVAVRNSGTADLNIVEISNETDVFDISERAFTLEAGATKDIFIEFNPEVIGEYSDVFLIKSEGLNDTTIQVFGNYTEPIPSIPDLISPDHSSTDVSVNPIFKWNSVEYATGYDFILLSKLDTVITMSISDTTITDLVLEYALDYSWKVRATNKIGDGDWSLAWNFTTIIERPSQVSLSSPSNDASGVVLRPTLSWLSSARSTEYDIQVSTDGFSSYVINATTTDTSYNVGTDLEYATTYSWRVRGTNTTGDGDWSSLYFFRTKPRLPQKVNLQSPSQGAIKIPTNPILGWVLDSNIDSYQVQVSKDSNFIDLIFSSEKITDSQIQIDGLEAASMYYWKTRGYNTSGFGSWSEVWNFTTDSLGTPILLHPINGESDQPINTTLKWSSSTNASSYELQVSKEIEFEVKAQREDIQDTLYATDILESNGSYYWRVRAVNSDTKSSWSGIGSFYTVYDEPGVSELLFPENTATGVDTNLVFEWGLAENSINYDLQISVDAQFNDLIFDSIGIEQRSVQVPETLDQSTNYYWRVRGRNPSGVGLWSESSTFETLPELPNMIINISPNFGSQDASINPILGWVLDSNIDSYQVQVSKDSNFIDLIFSSEKITDSQIQIDGLEAASMYYWKTRGYNTSGFGSWSEVWNFTTDSLGTPILLHPINGESDQPINTTLKWSSSTNASSYELQVSKEIEFEVKAQREDIQDTLYATDILESNGSYYWRVRAVNSDTKSSWSGIGSFYTVYDEPGVSELLFPENTATGVDTNLVFEWGLAENSINYDLQISVDAQFNDLIFDSIGIEQRSVQVPETLDQSTNYYWRVRGRNPSGVGLWSESSTFETLPELPNIPILLSPEDRIKNLGVDINFNWVKIPASQKYRFQLSNNDLFEFSIDTTISDTVLFIPNLEYNTSYYWRVKGYNASGFGDWSQIYSFKTILQVPDEVIIIQPTMGDYILPLINEFIWTEASRAQEYNIQFSSDSLFAAIIKDTTGIKESRVRNITLEQESSFYWRVRGINEGGFGLWSVYSGFQTVHLTNNEYQDVPSEFILYQNYPNPFNPVTIIKYGLPKTQNITHEIYNILGQKVLTLFDGLQNAGYHSVTLDASQLPSGVYVYSIWSEEGAESKLLTLIK